MRPCTPSCRECDSAGAIAAARRAGALAVEMEAAALYAYGRVCSRDIVCLALLTNEMGQIEGDFEKDDADGVAASLRVVAATAREWLERRGGR